MTTSARTPHPPGAVGAGFYPARAVRNSVFTKPIGESDGALREGQAPPLRYD